MARKPTQQERLETLLKQYEAEIGAAMLAGFADLRANVDLQRLTAALASGDTSDAIAALHLDAAAFHPMDQAERNAFVAAGVAMIAALPVLTNLFGVRVVVRFNPADPQAVMAFNQATAKVASGLVDDQVQMIRSLITERLAANADPRSVALEIVGRINPATGVREGGLIGLSSPQAQFVESARTELASADPALLRNYLTRTLRDAKFDPAVRAAIDSGKPVSNAIADRAVQSYSNRLLLQRGRTVGLAQAQDMLGQGQEAAMQQAVAAGGLAGVTINADWRSVGDTKVRPTHQELNGESVPFGQPFRSSSGALMRWPGDTALGAGPDEIVNCRCRRILRPVFQANQQEAA